MELWADLIISAKEEHEYIDSEPDFESEDESKEESEDESKEERPPKKAKLS